MTDEEFIDKIGKHVIKFAPEYGIECCSAIIAQACLESGYGKSSLAVLAHNYFGVKLGSYTGDSITLNTQEEINGQLITISDTFRKYAGISEGVKGYFDVISIPRYQNLKGIKDPQTYLETIKADGYCTDSKYVDKCMNLISQWNLTRFDDMSKIELAIRWMENLANDASHGYDQVNRWGPDYDCSSAVISAWENAGVPVKSKYGATYTGNMYKAFTTAGFEDVTTKVDRLTGKNMARGDVLLNHAHHTAMYVGNGREVEASINEKGTISGGQIGDQTGKEILIRTYRNYPWDCVLRYPEAITETATDNGVNLSTWKKVQAATFTDASHAKSLANKLTSNGIVSYWYHKGDYYFVGCGSFPVDAAKTVLEKLKTFGITGMIW